MKHNPWITAGLVAAWVLIFVMLLELHWRPARVMLPIVSVMLLVYISACTIHSLSLWLRRDDTPKPPVDEMGHGEIAEMPSIDCAEEERKDEHGKLRCNDSAETN